MGMSNRNNETLDAVSMIAPNSQWGAPAGSAGSWCRNDQGRFHFNPAQRLPRLNLLLPRVMQSGWNLIGFTRQ